MSHQDPDRQESTLKEGESPAASPKVGIAEAVGEDRVEADEVLRQSESEPEEPDIEEIEDDQRYGARKRPCFHCGAPTSIRVLEKTGDLCWRCYRPIGQTILKTLVIVTMVLVVVAGGLVGWRLLNQEETPQVRPPQESAAREFTPEQKITILKRYLLDRVPAAVICSEYELAPDELQRWQQQFFEVAETAFSRTQVREPNLVDRRVAGIEQKIQTLGKTLAELRESVQQLRREAGRYEGTNSQQFILESAGPPPRP